VKLVKTSWPQDVETDLAQLIDVPIECCIDLVGRRFTEDGGNHWVESVKQIIETPDVLARESVLVDYYADFCFNSAQKLLMTCFSGVQVDAESQKRIGTVFPWSYVSYLKQRKVIEETAIFDVEETTKSDYWGPKTFLEVEKEFERIKSIYLSIVDIGYDPKKFKDKYNLHPYPWGVVLKYQDQLRFVVLSGKHKLSVLAALGYRSVQVKLRPHSINNADTYPMVLDLTNIGNWPCVRHGFYSEKTARSLFLGYFSDKGHGN